MAARFWSWSGRADRRLEPETGSNQPKVLVITWYVDHVEANRELTDGCWELISWVTSEWYSWVISFLASAEAEYDLGVKMWRGRVPKPSKD